MDRCPISEFASVRVPARLVVEESLIAAPRSSCAETSTDSSPQKPPPLGGRREQTSARYATMRIYADFNGALIHEHDSSLALVPLEKFGTLRDLCTAKIRLRPGLV